MTLRHPNLAMIRQLNNKFIDEDQFRWLQDNYLVDAPSCGVSLTSGFSTDHNTWYNVTWDNAVWEYPEGTVWMGDGDPLTNKHRLHVPYDGYYVSLFRFVWDSNSSGARDQRVYCSKNGEYWNEYIEANATYHDGSMCLVAEYDAGDYSYAYVRQTSGGSLTFSVGSGAKMQMFRLAV